MLQDHTSNNQFFIVSLLTFSFAIALFAPKAVIENSIRSFVSNRNDVIQEGVVQDLRPYNGFVSHEIFFERENISKPLHTAFDYKSTVELRDSNLKPITKEFTGKIYPITPNRQSLFTGSYRLFLSQSIQHQKSSIHVQIPHLPANIKSITLIGKCGNPQYNQFLVLTRVIFQLFSIIEIIIILQKKNSKEHSHLIFFWLLLFAADPLMVIHYYHPMSIFPTIDGIAQAIFDAYFRFYLISILSSFRESVYSRLPTVFFFCIYLITKISHNLSSSLKGIDFLTAVTTQSLPILTFELGLEMTYITWLIVSVGSSYSKAKASFEKGVMKPIYCIISMTFVIYLLRIIINKIKSSFSEPVNIDFLNYIMFYTIAYLIGYNGSRNFTDLKISRLIHDVETPEPLTAVFE